MGIFDKLMFWRKDEDADFDRLAEDTMKKEEMGDNSGWGMEQAPLGSPNRPLFPQDAADRQQAETLKQGGGISGVTAGEQSWSVPGRGRQGGSPPEMGGGTLAGREIELINSKLDTIKAVLGSIDQRLGAIEQEKREQKKLW